MESLIFYIVTFGISTFFIALVDFSEDKKSKLIFSFIGLVIPILIFSLRYDVGTDYANYLNLYKRWSSLSIGDIIAKKNLEIFFIIIMKIAYIFKTPQIIFIIYSTANILIIYKAIQTNKNKISVSLAFLLFLLIYTSIVLNVIRQSLAVAIIAYSYKYIIKRNFKKFLICVILASLFHTTALIIIPFYFINYQKDGRKDKTIKLLITIGSVLVVIFYARLIGVLTQINAFSKYLLYDNSIESNNYMFFIKFLTFSLLLIFRKKLYNYNKKNKMYYYFLLVDLILYSTGFISPFIKRIALYFGISEIFIISQIPKIIKEKKYKNLIILAIIFYALGIFIVSTYVLGQSNIIPYQTIFNK